ncbi:MAG: dihydrodipicolinate synthase family protein [Gemmatimonadetes bacterium]|nr:dihydrodipicolinate synthase family protein [Gemmatimonadota bacterium]
MKTTPITSADLNGVFPVPPLARKSDPRRTISIAENERLLEHMAAGGLRRFLYGGNAFLYHITLSEYEQLLEWLSGAPDDFWMIPSAGPSFGRAMDQAPLLRPYRFPAVMLLPSGDPRDAAGLERGLREFAAEAETRLVLYLKEENNFGADAEAGLDVVARLVDEGICAFIKYAVVRRDPAVDPYLEALLRRVDRSLLVSGIGERPAVVHMQEWGLPGFTTGSGCVQPRLSQALFEACVRGEYKTAEEIRQLFLPLEDLRDAWGPARVLHHATELAGIAETGSIPPFISPLPADQLETLAPVARDLFAGQGAGQPQPSLRAGARS